LVRPNQSHIPAKKLAGYPGQSVVRFFGEVLAELRKSEWPSRHEAIRLTGMVIALSAMVGIFLTIVDLLFDFVSKFILGV
jgi:preprotein translocase subunit SecE